MLLGHHSLFLGLLDFSKHENLPLLLWNVPGTLGPDTFFFFFFFSWVVCFLITEF